MISGPKSRNLPKFCTFSRKSALFRKNPHFPALFAPKRKKRARLPGPIKTNAFYRYFELIFAKRRKCAEFCVFVRIFGFLRTFRFFRSKTEKIAKVRFERKVPLRTSHETYIYIRIPTRTVGENNFFAFSTFSFLGRLE